MAPLSSPWMFSLALAVLVPQCEAYPKFVPCGTDDATKLQIGVEMMGVKITSAPALLSAANTSGKASTTYIAGQTLSLKLAGVPPGAQMVLRVSDDGATGTLSKDKRFRAKCPSQLYTTKGLEGADFWKVDLGWTFRAPCKVKAGATITVTAVYSAGKKKPVLLTKLALAQKPGLDPSCTGPAPPTPTPAPPRPSRLILEGLVEGFLSDQPDLKTCIGDSEVALGDVGAAFKDILKRDLPDVANGLRKLADAMDAVPGALKECKASASDVRYMIDVLKEIKGFKKLATHMVRDLIANFEDILTDLRDSAAAYKGQRYEDCGRKLGMTFHRIIIGKQPLRRRSPAFQGFANLPWNLSWQDVPLPTVRGTVPRELLGGTLFRGSQGRWYDDIPRPYWIDAFGFIAAFKFGSDGVRVSGEFVRSDKYNKSAAAASAGMKLQQPAAAKPGELGHIPWIPGMSDDMTSDTGIAFFNASNHWITPTAISTPNEFDFNNLHNLATPWHWDDDLKGPFMCPVHYQELNGLGEYGIPDDTLVHHLNVQQGIPGDTTGLPDGYIVVKVPPGSRKREIVANVSAPGGARYQHMQLVAGKYYVMVEQPCHMPLIPPSMAPWAHMQWKTEEGTTVRLIDIETGEVQAWPLERNVYSVHHANAYIDETTGNVVIQTQDYMNPKGPEGYEGCKSQKEMYVDTLQNDPLKWTATQNMSVPIIIEVPLKKPGATATVRVLSENPQGYDMLTFQANRNGRRTRFFWGINMNAPDSVWWDQLSKVDAETGAVTSWMWCNGKGHVISPDTPGCGGFAPGAGFPTEVAFQPAVPNGEDSGDDGIVLTTVLDSAKNATFLVVLNASNWAELALVGPTPNPLPLWYHSRWVPNPEPLLEIIV